MHHPSCLPKPRRRQAIPSLSRRGSKGEVNPVNNFIALRGELNLYENK